LRSLLSRGERPPVHAGGLFLRPAQRYLVQEGDAVSSVCHRFGGRDVAYVQYAVREE
jgi:hypothetical protein